MLKNKIYFIIFLIISTINVYSQNNYQVAIQNNIIKLDSADNDVDRIRINLEIAQLYLLDGDADKSINFLKDIDKLKKKTSIQPILEADIAKVYGDAYLKKGRTKKAFDYFEDQLDILQNAGINTDSVKYNIASLEYKQELYDDAAEHYKQLLAATTDNNMKARLYKSLYITYKADKKYEDALFYLNEYLSIIDKNFYDATNQINILNKRVKQSDIKLTYTQNQLDQTQIELFITEDSLLTTVDSLNIVNTVKDSLTIQNLILLEKKSRHDIVREHKSVELLKKEKRLSRKDKELAQEKKINYLLSIIIIIILIAGIYIYTLFRKIKRQNILLRKQRTEIQKKNALIIEKNKQITDSIFYASNIQKSILPPTIQIDHYLPNTFIFFKPRDIVSGDFYWFSKKQDKLLISAIDCTGHGVPGAFISMIGNTLLNKIVNEDNITSPAEVLQNLHEQMREALQQADNEAEAEDGMDLAFCVIEPKINKLTFAGAKNDLMIFDGNEFSSLKSDFISIGEKPLRPGREAKFTEKTLEYNENTQIFLMTDGMVDQFGVGKNGNEKFNNKRIKNLIKETYTKPFSEITQKYEQTMKDWMINNEQTDDMLVIGIKLSDVSLH